MDKIEGSKNPARKITGAEGGFNAWDPAVIKEIDKLIDLARPPNELIDNRDLVRQMIVTALKTQYSQLDRGDVKILSRSLRELRYGFRIFKEYRDRPKVTMFGSARTQPGDPEYKQALTFSRKMAKNGFMMITGAGPGIMKAGNEGAGKGNSFGINIRLPFEQTANEFIFEDPRFVDCRFFFTRKLMFIKETSAVVFFPGGFGTHDEGFETLTLVQTGKCDPMPLVFIDAPGGNYWNEWYKFILKQLLKKGKISREDLSIFKITDSVDKAVEEILHFYRNYHSMRYVKDDLVIRLKKPLSPESLADLNSNFQEICVRGRGRFRLSEPLLEENDHLDLPRIVFPFNRHNFGLLRQLINRINSY
jgi:uncharacterized protein (TIGR00730 family)